MVERKNQERWRQTGVAQVGQESGDLPYPLQPYLHLGFSSLKANFSTIKTGVYLEKGKGGGDSAGRVSLTKDRGATDVMV